MKKWAALNVIDFRLIRALGLLQISCLGSSGLARQVLFWSKALRTVESLFTSLFTSDVMIYVTRKTLLCLGFQLEFKSQINQLRTLNV